MGATLSPGAQQVTRSGQLAGAAVATGLGVLLSTTAAMLLVVPAGLGSTPTPESRAPGWLVVVATLVLGLGLATSWADRRTRPHAPLGLAVAAVAALLPTWAGWSGIPVGARVAMLPVAVFVAPGITHAVFGRGGRVGSVLDVAWVTSTAAYLVHLATYDPFRDPTCLRICSQVSSPIHLLLGVEATAAGLRVSLALSLVSAVLCIGALVVGGRGLGLRWSILGTGLGSLLLVVALDGMHLSRLGSSLQPAPSRTWLVLGVGACGVVLAAGAVHRIRTRHRIDVLLRGLERAEPNGGPRSGFAFSVPGEDRWVLIDGTDAEFVPGTPRTEQEVPAVVVATGRPLSERHLSPVRRVGLANARLEALARARLRDLQDAQRRSVARSDEEQRRIERDLHDGAQQHLVGAALHLGLAARRGGPAYDAHTAKAADEVTAALERLRRLTHGSIPAVLSDEGLTAALEELALDGGPPLRWSADGVAGLPPEQATAIYLVAVAARAQADEAGADLHVRVDAERVVLNVVLPPRGSARALSIDAVDRVEALGGTLTWSTRDGAVALEVVIPCGS